MGGHGIERRSDFCNAISGLFLLAAAQLAPAQAQSPDSQDDLLPARGVELYQAGKYAEAIPIAEQYIKVASTTLGEDNPVYANGLGYLAVLDQALNRTAEAEALFKRALAIKEKALGSDHKEVAEAVFNLAEFYRDQGRYPEAEALYKRATMGPDDLTVAAGVNGLGQLYQAQGRYAEAEHLYKRALESGSRLVPAIPMSR